MITLDQIKQLDQKVQKAVSCISTLKLENNSLKQKLDEYQKRIEELEILISDFKRDQGEIEKGIINALSQLEKLEHDQQPPSAEETISSSATPNTASAETDESTTDDTSSDASGTELGEETAGETSKEQLYDTGPVSESATHEESEENRDAEDETNEEQDQERGDDLGLF